MPKLCQDCGLSSWHHVQTWPNGLLDCFLPPWPHALLAGKIERFFVFLGLASWKDNFTRADIPLRSSCFIEEAQKRGFKFRALRGPWGYTGHFQAKFKDKTFYFDGLPVGEFLNGYRGDSVSDKKTTKRRLKNSGFPVAEGEAFWFFQKAKAISYTANQLGFPVVVKPRSGSVSRHVTTNINDLGELRRAINKVVSYSPTFIVERFVSNASVFRATVVDFDFVACVQQIPANVVGDGHHSIGQLIGQKNEHPLRGQSHQKEFILFKLVIDETTLNLLSDRGYGLDSVPGHGEVIWLQKNSFLKLGGDLTEVTARVHPDNRELFCNLAEFFGLRVAGIDFMVGDISRSWKNQTSAVLELNSVPCIEMHHFPFSGQPQNVAKELTNMVLKYYQ